MRKLAVIGLVNLVLVACSSHITQADPTGGPVSDTDGVIARFTNDIWPAINDYNGVVSAQGGPADQQFTRVSDQSGDMTDLRVAVQRLGRPGYRSGHEDEFRDPRVGLRLGHVELTALNPPTATLSVCYTYSLIDGDRARPPQPTASEITVELHKSDTWLLHSITNDHVVPGCDPA